MQLRREQGNRKKIKREGRERRGIDRKERGKNRKITTRSHGGKLKIMTMFMIHLFPEKTITLTVITFLKT